MADLDTGGEPVGRIDVRGSVMGDVNTGDLDQLEISGVRGDDRPSLIDAHIAAFKMGQVYLRQVDVAGPQPASGRLITTQIGEYQHDRMRFRQVTDTDAGPDPTTPSTASSPSKAA